MGRFDEWFSGRRPGSDDPWGIEERRERRAEGERRRAAEAEREAGKAAEVGAPAVADEPPPSETSTERSADTESVAPDDAALVEEVDRGLGWLDASAHARQDDESEDSSDAWGWLEGLPERVMGNEAVWNEPAADLAAALMLAQAETRAEHDQIRKDMSRFQKRDEYLQAQIDRLRDERKQIPPEDVGRSVAWGLRVLRLALSIGIGMLVAGPLAAVLPPSLPILRSEMAKGAIGAFAGWLTNELTKPVEGWARPRLTARAERRAEEARQDRERQTLAEIDAAFESEDGKPPEPPVRLPLGITDGQRGTDHPHRLGRDRDDDDGRPPPRRRGPNSW